MAPTTHAAARTPPWRTDPQRRRCPSRDVTASCGSRPAAVDAPAARPMSARKTTADMGSTRGERPATTAATPVHTRNQVRHDRSVSPMHVSCELGPDTGVTRYRAGLCVGVLLGLELEGDVDELVLLATDELALPRDLQDPRAGDAVALGRVAGVLQEAGVHPGVAHHHRHPVEAALLGHRRAHDVLGGVDDLHEVDPGAPAELVADPDEGVERSV